MPPPHLPLRWEGMGDQWWYASPIDWAAANGQFDLVRELLLLDPNLIIKLTSLRRIRRLESVWDDESQFESVAKCRCRVAKKLLYVSEVVRRRNSLIESGYGGWLLYIGASAGDVGFVKELLERKPLLVFGEGEYGVTDMLYAASRSKNSEVFRVLFDFAISPRYLTRRKSDVDGQSIEVPSVCKFDIMNRAVHAAARGGDLEILKELLKDCSNILVYRDLEGSTVLHSAAGSGQVEVVKELIASFDIITSKDNQGNTALHVAAYFGHSAVVEALIISLPSSILIPNNAGDTFFHAAVVGFQTPGFRRLDRHKELMNQLIYGNIVDIQSIVNCQNKDGRTALHLAFTGSNNSNLIQLLLTTPSINLNICDVDGMTPLDLLVRRPPGSASSEILIKKLISAGCVSNSQYCKTNCSYASPLKVQVMIPSPGTSFRIPDAEILSYVGIKKLVVADDQASECISSSSGEVSEIDAVNENDTGGKHLMALLNWHQKKERKSDGSEKSGEDDSVGASSGKQRELDSLETSSAAPLRQKFSKPPAVANNERVLSVRTKLPSPSTKKKFSAELMHGVIQATPELTPPVQSPSGSLSRSMSSPASVEKSQGIDTTIGGSSSAISFNPSLGDSSSTNKTRNSVSSNKRLMNQYFCFGTHGIAVNEPISRVLQPNQVAI
ncbi:hypothetical protein Scep_021049 [Stephania cephalantha]|uniref:Uncharacterized protein n=1 Tax=Stephania cephalantha TaxID=152367 RepID=A0AAP0I178_9MAGN